MWTLFYWKKKLIEFVEKFKKYQHPVAFYVEVIIANTDDGHLILIRFIFFLIFLVFFYFVRRFISVKKIIENYKLHKRRGIGGRANKLRMGREEQGKRHIPSFFFFFFK